MAHSGHVCISDIFEWSSKDTTASENDKVQKRLTTFLQSVYREGTKIPILVVSNDEEQVSQFVRILYQHFGNKISNHQLFFSLVPSPELLSRLKQLSQVSTVFTLTSQLPDIPERKHFLSQFRSKVGRLDFVFHLFTNFNINIFFL